MPPVSPLAPPPARAMLRAATAACALWAACAAAPVAAQQVDLQLVLAVDVSRSVDAMEGRLQRQGYVDAFSDPQLIQAILNGRFGRIAVTYFEWAERTFSRMVAPWTVIASAADAQAFARALTQDNVQVGTWTSLSGAIDLAAAMFPFSGFRSERRVIDISGDGPNNDGGNVALARDDAVAGGITINGLPILTDDGTVLNLPDLDVYYRECVIGGPGSFVIAAENFHSFGQAILRKLILEIADLAPTWPAADGIIKVQQGPYFGPAAAARKYAPACEVGEYRRT